MIVMINKSVNYMSEFEPEIVTLKSVKRYYVKGYASTIDKDLVDDVLTIEAQKDIHDQCQDIIKKGGFFTGDVEHLNFYDETGKQLDWPKLKDAKGNIVIPELKLVDSELTDRGVIVKVEVNQHLPHFKTLWKSIEDGFLNAFSVAVLPIQKITKRIDGIMTDFINKVRVINLTITGTPCNPNALMQPVLKAVLQKMDDNMNNILKHKYIRREGSAGNYTYVYSENPQDKKEYDGVKQSESKKEIIAGAKQIEAIGSKDQLNAIYDLNAVDQKIVAYRVGLETKKESSKSDVSAKIDEALKEVYMVNKEDGNVSDSLQEYAESKGWSTSGPKKKSINTYLKTKGDKMDEKFKEKYDKLTDDQKKEFDELDEEKQQEYIDNLPEEQVDEAQADETEANTEDTKEPELKSLIVSLKSEILKTIESKNKELGDKLSVELKSLKDKIEKIENTPMKKSLMADKTAMLGVDDKLQMRELNALDLI